MKCLYKFTCRAGAGAADDAAAKRRCVVVVEANGIPRILHALQVVRADETTQKCAVLTLGRLCKVARSRHFAGLVDASVAGAVVDVYKAHKGSDAKVCKSCRAVMNKLLA